MTTVRIVALVCRDDDAPGRARLLAASAAAGVALRPVFPAALVPPGEPGAPALALTRLSSGTPPALLLPLRAAESRGLRFVNAPSALAVVHEKAAAHAALLAAGVPVVPTVLVVRDADPRAALAPLAGERFVVKTETGTSGRGVVTGLSRAQVERAAAAFAELSGPVLVQPELGGGVDRRLFVVDGRIVACMERQPGDGGRANLRVGARARPFEPSTEEVALARRAASALRLDVAGVDLLHDAGRSLVLEVNASPGLKGIETVTGRDVAGAIVALAARRLATL
jgi:ribosomal protein S6--L-glutamate ligase